MITQAIHLLNPEELDTTNPKNTINKKRPLRMFGVMKIGVVKERRPGELRVGLVPGVVKTLVSKGHEVMVEANAGFAAGCLDAMYTEAGATVVDAATIYSTANVIVRVASPLPEEIQHMRSGTVLISTVFAKRQPEIATALSNAGVSVFALDALPRITRAQVMDVLSSQNNLAGYKAVLVGANAMGRIFPLMTTAAGTVKPSTVLIYGAGVAGLQALATARRLGAVVHVTDLRPETREQVESLGGRFVSVDGLDDVKVVGGYVAAAADDVLQRQKEAVNKVLYSADLVITTALVAGGQAPCLITQEQVEKMKPGAVIVDLAADAGGNCACTDGANTTTVGAVTIIGCPQLAASIPNTASELYAKNVLAFIGEIAPEGTVSFDVQNEIIGSTLIVHNGEVRN